MKFIGVDGNTYGWVCGASHVQSGDLKSKIEVAALSRLQDWYPLQPIIYEFHLPCSPRLSLDFFLPYVKIAVECDGQQHMAYNPHFHKSRMDYLKQVARDRYKQEFCDINGIKLIRWTAEDFK